MQWVIAASVPIGLSRLLPCLANIPSGVAVQPAMGASRARRAVFLEAFPDLLVEVETDRVAQRLDRRHQPADRYAAGQRIGHAEGDDEVHDGEGQGLEHGCSPLIENHSSLAKAYPGARPSGNRPVQSSA